MKLKIEIRTKSWHQKRTVWFKGLSISLWEQEAWRNETMHHPEPFALVLHGNKRHKCSCAGRRWHMHTCCSWIIVWKERSKHPVRVDGERCSWKIVFLDCSNATSTEQNSEILDYTDKLMRVGDSISSSVWAASVQPGFILTDGCSTSPCATLKGIMVG